MGTEGEFVDIGAFTAEIENTDLARESAPETQNWWQLTDLRVWYTTIVSRLGVGLILAVTVAASGTATH